MLEALIAFLAGVIVPLIKGIVADWRRDQALKDLGRAEAQLHGERNAKEAERRAGAVLAEHRTADDAARRLRDGTF
jgi:hypothetical protein